LPSNFGDFWQFWQLWQISRAAGFALPITAIPRDDGDSGDLYLCFLIPPCFKVLPSNFGDFWHFWQLPDPAVKPLYSRSDQRHQRSSAVRFCLSDFSDYGAHPKTTSCRLNASDLSSHSL
jgi:hypothetical protein